MWSLTLSYLLLVSLFGRNSSAGRYDVRKRNLFSVQHDVVVVEQVDVTVQSDGSLLTSTPVPVETLSFIGTPSLVALSTPTPTVPSPNPNDKPQDAPKDEAPDDNVDDDAETDETPIDPSVGNDEEDIVEPAPDSVVSEPDAAATDEASPVPTPNNFKSPADAPIDRAVAIPQENTPSDPSSLIDEPTEINTPTESVEQVTELITPVSAPASYRDNIVSQVGAKRGIAYNDAQKLSAFSSSSKFSWAYNWGSSTTSIPQKYEYVPMLWGLGHFTDGWTAAADHALASGSTHILAFNEPDLGAQASLSVPQAVEGYKRYVQPYAGKARLGSPAVTNGGAPMGLTYLTEFIVACAGCTIDFVAIHWYNGGNSQDFKEYVTKAHILSGGRPVWITEFEASGDPSQQQAFLNDVLPWLDSQDFVERYAYFMASDGNLISSGTSLSSIGQAFAFQ